MSLNVTTEKEKHNSCWHYFRTIIVLCCVVMIFLYAVNSSICDPMILADLHKLGGLTAVTRELNNPNPEIRTLSAWILGKASQNNPFVQKKVFISTTFVIQC